MLKTVWFGEKNSGVAMLLGGFDGVHLGHRKLLSCAQKSGLSVGVMTIVGGKGEMLFTEREREDIFCRNGVAFVFELPFAEICALSPREFLDVLTKEFSPKLFVCGEDFRFGAGAKGTPSVIQEGGQVCVEVLPLVEIDGEKVSSRTIKNLLQVGDIPKANEMLGENFFLLGKVEKDRQVGRTIGFPTANVAYPKEKFPLKKGVYETRVFVDEKEYKAITNYGARPTFGDESVWTESHLDGFDGNLYDKELRVEFVRYLRDITKFDGVDALKKQLEEDIRRVREND